MVVRSRRMARRKAGQRRRSEMLWTGGASPGWERCTMGEEDGMKKNQGKWGIRAGGGRSDGVISVALVGSSIPTSLKWSRWSTIFPTPQFELEGTGSSAALHRNCGVWGVWDSLTCITVEAVKGSCPKHARSNKSWLEWQYLSLASYITNWCSSKARQVTCSEKHYNHLLNFLMPKVKKKSSTVISGYFVLNFMHWWNGEALNRWFAQWLFYITHSSTVLCVIPHDNYM